MGFVEQSTPYHVAIVMDGNGRWAAGRGWPRVAGHRAGAVAVRRTVEAAAEMGIPVLTLYAFSADNWQRPPAEVAALMALFREFLESEAITCAREAIRLNVIGRRDRLHPGLLDAIISAEQVTAAGSRLLLRLAVDYSARDAILRASALHGQGVLTRESFGKLIASSTSSVGDAHDVDLLIRTGGERRVSDFMLWEIAYAELYFTSTMWPDFDGAELRRAVADFASRERRYGRIPA